MENNKESRFIATTLKGITVFKNDKKEIEMNTAKEQFEQLVEQLHNVGSSEELHEELFSKIASFLMNEVCIIAGDNSYRIMECEFYYDFPEKHKDPYVHAIDKSNNKYAVKKQSKIGEWYFHDYRTGIDITIGNNDKKIFGGILIRGLHKLNTDENDPYYIGPIITIKELFNNMGGAFKGSLSLKYLEEKYLEGKIKNIYRRGLTKKENEENNYHEKHHRYIVVELSDYRKHKKFHDKEHVEKLCNGNR
jgi:hypothetical protein